MKNGLIFHDGRKTNVCFPEWNRAQSLFVFQWKKTSFQAILPYVKIFDKLTESGIRIEDDFEMGKLTSLRTGGCADYIAFPENAGQIADILSLCHDSGIPVTVTGGLTNCLVSDEGIRGMVICTRHIKGLVMKGGLFIAYAGESLENVINKSIEHNLTGLEELGGIPGTAGGATWGNAGANGVSISTFFFYADYMTADGKLKRMPSFCDAFSYRKSPFSKGDVILSTAFRLKADRNSAVAREKKEYYKEERRRKGQYDALSAGCFFRNPPALSAGSLIEQAGMKGFEHGGAMVSTRHANFIINKGNASSRDIFELSELVQNAVEKKFGITLEREVSLLGKFQ